MLSAGDLAYAWSDRLKTTTAVIYTIYDLCPFITDTIEKLQIV